METRMWLNRVDENILIPMGDGFRNGVMHDFFKDRRPGTLVPEAVEGNKRSAAVGLKWLDDQMADGRTWVAGARFSLADIRLYVVYSFYASVDKSSTAVIRLAVSASHLAISLCLSFSLCLSASPFFMLSLSLWLSLSISLSVVVSYSVPMWMLFSCQSRTPLRL